MHEEHDSMHEEHDSMREEHDAPETYDVAAAKAAAAKLQEAAAGGTPVAIPGSTDPVTAITPHDNLPPIPSTDDDRAEDRLDGGGRI